MSMFRYYYDGRCVFCFTILAVIPQLRALMELIVDIRKRTQSSGQVGLVYDAQFLFNIIIHKALPYVVSGVD